MERFAPYLGIVAALALGIVAAVFVGPHVVVQAPASSSSPQAASSSVSVLPGLSLPTLVLPAIATSSRESLPAATSTPAPALVPHETTTAPPPSTKPETPASPPSTPSSPPAQTASAPVPASQTVSSGNAALDSAASALRAALVNIICYAPAGSRIRSISGSGVIVSPDGLILTNAHVAQYFLLADQGVSCTIRTGTPATDAYLGKLAFISPAWIHANASLITNASPSGTGEHDYAFVAIAKSVDGSALPASFPNIPLSAYPPSAGVPVVIASYGAQFLSTTQVQSALFPTIVFGAIKDVYTFGTNTVDVLALGGSAAAQEGSSGGGVATGAGALVGTITTSSITGATDTRSLDAITSSYVRASYASETGQPLEFLLTESTSTAVASFASSAASLEAVLLAAIGT
jgi:hypothetical protein